MPRILELLNRHDVKASFYVPAVAALLHTEEQQRVFVEGYKIGIHSWIKLNSVLPSRSSATSCSDRPIR